MKKPTTDFPIEDTRFGFIYGPAHVERICNDKRSGIYIAIITKREEMHIRITGGGRISVYSHDKKLRKKV